MTITEQYKNTIYKKEETNGIPRLDDQRHKQAATNRRTKSLILSLNRFSARLITSLTSQNPV